MDAAELSKIAKYLVADNKGILAADESSSTIKKRFEKIGIEDTTQNHRKYRQMLFTAPEIEKYISGVILYDETIRQKDDSGKMFTEMLDECYPEVTVGNCTFSPSAVMAECDPTAFRIGVDEYLSSLKEDCQLYELNGDYYQVSDIEAMLDEIDSL